MLKKIIEYILGFIGKQSKKESESKDRLGENAIGGITFILNADKTVNVSCYIPETDKMSVEEITNTAEDYAELLMYINDGLLSSKIIDFIKSTIKTSEYEQDKLFFDNVLTFWAIHHVYNKQSQKNKSNHPLIMPSKVFNI